MMRRLLQRRQIRCGIGARRLEGKYARIGHSDVCGGIIGRRAQRRLESLASAAHRLAVECLEGCTSFNERTVWREQCVEVGIGMARLTAFNGRTEAIPAPRHRFDVWRAVLLRAERLPQARDGLLDTV